MNQNHSLLKFFIAFRCLSIVIPIVSHPALAECNKDQLPFDILKLIELEQNHLDQNDFKPNTEEYNPEFASYSPESGNTFTVRSYWIPQQFAVIERDEDAIGNHQPELFKNIGDQNLVRFFVHPLTEPLYTSYFSRIPNFTKFNPETLPGAQGENEFCATATSSVRTVLIWKEDQSFHPFFVKLSINTTLSGHHRFVSLKEGHRAIQNSLILKSLNYKKFFPEILSVHPSFGKRTDAGTIVRDIPQNYFGTHSEVIPLFSLFSSVHQQSGKPPLLELLTPLTHENECILDPVRSTFLRPFFKALIRAALQNGIIPEAHAQNVLIEWNSKQRQIEDFILRDLSDFKLDQLRWTEGKKNALVQNYFYHIFSVLWDAETELSRLDKVLNHSWKFVKDLNRRLKLWEEQETIDLSNCNNASLQTTALQDFKQSLEEVCEQAIPPMKTWEEVHSWMFQYRLNQLRELPVTNYLLTNFWMAFGGGDR